MAGERGRGRGRGRAALDAAPTTTLDPRSGRGQASGMTQEKWCHQDDLIVRPVIQETVVLSNSTKGGLRCFCFDALVDVRRDLKYLGRRTNLLANPLAQGNNEGQQRVGFRPVARQDLDKVMFRGTGCDQVGHKP